MTDKNHHLQFLKYQVTALEKAIDFHLNTIEELTDRLEQQAKIIQKLRTDNRNRS